MRRGELTVGDVFANAARTVPSATAVVLGDTTLSFGQLHTGARAAARALADLGARPGHVVAVWSGTSLDAVVLFAALAEAGVVYAPMGAGLSSDEARALLDAARPSLLVVDAEHVEAGEALASDTGVALATVAGLAALASGRAEAPGVTGPGEPLARRAGHTVEPGPPTPVVGEDDPHVVFFTSGSTGRPKGVVLSHRVNVLRTHPGALLEPRGAMVCPYPLFHMGAWTIALQQWQARACVVLLERADARGILDAVARHGATRLNAIPAVWRRVVDAAHAGRSPAATGAGASPALATLRFADTGTSATPVELLESIAALAPDAYVRVFYGSTEAGSVAALGHEDIRRKPGSCGVPVPGAEVRLSDAGELLVRSPVLFDGYYDDDDATTAAFDDGWYRTGDLAELDDEGYLTIVGRVRDVIRTGGETVSPSEVEAVLATHPAVADVAVVGIPDPTWGEVVCAVVVLVPGAAPPSPEDLRAHGRGRLADFKLPRRVAAVDAIPRTPATRQVMRRLLVERLG
ncbi:MAG TPA: class I adenylate-forming enzyme family protein [Acidimicrobiales bacterium]|nr:class I adenylate-forming enzyme family protein [Acidimicrobiales bacterium]